MAPEMNTPERTSTDPAPAAEPDTAPQKPSLDKAALQRKLQAYYQLECVRPTSERLQLFLDQFLRKAEELRLSEPTRRRMGDNALRYARETFDIERITDRFEALFESLVCVDAVVREDEPVLANERA